MDYCRIKIVGSNLDDLGLTSFSGLLNSTNSFILDVTKAINSSKSAIVSEYPTYPDGRKRIGQVVVENETLTVDGKLSKYNTITERPITDIKLFRKFLETLVENAVLLDIETESKSHYNYILHSSSVGVEGLGSISVSLQFREAWLIGPAKNVTSEYEEITPNEDINDLVNQQSLKAAIDSLHGKMLSKETRNPYTSKDPSSVDKFLSKFFDESLKIGAKYSEVISKEVRTIKVLKHGRKEAKVPTGSDFYSDYFLNGIVDWKGNIFTNKKSWIQYASFIDKFDFIYFKDDKDSIAELGLTFRLTSRYNDIDEHSEIKNQLVYYNVNHEYRPVFPRDVGRHVDAQTADVTISKHWGLKYNGDPNTTQRNFKLNLRYDIEKYLNSDKFTANSPFQVVKSSSSGIGLKIGFLNPGTYFDKDYGVFFMSHYYDRQVDGVTLVEDSKGYANLNIRINYMTSRFAIALAQAIKGYITSLGTAGGLSEDLEMFANERGF